MNGEEAMARDARPGVAIGHMRLAVDDVPEAYRFFAKHGMREVLLRAEFAILELRGGTHLILAKSETPLPRGERTPFDLMVDDVDAAHRRFADDGVSVSAIERGSIHDSFTVEGPSGYVLPINSSHVVGAV